MGNLGIGEFRNWGLERLCGELFRLRIAHYRFLLVIISFPCFLPPSSFAGPVITIDADRQFKFAGRYFRAGEYYRAIGEYERFICFFPGDARNELALYKIGLSYFKGEKFEEAINAFNALLNLLLKVPFLIPTASAASAIVNCCI